tara:strand:+ start:364 stop:483 length:120 start_codon:yes stop_codon:yes gene_type:complete
MRNIIINTAYGLVMLGVVTLFVIKDNFTKKGSPKNDRRK